MGLFNLFKTKPYHPQKHKIPRGVTPKEYAAELIDTVKECASDINNSSDVFDFTYSYTKFVESIEELIWLNETKHVPMYPRPRAELDTVYENMPATIDDFVSRALQGIQSSGLDRADDLAFLIHQIETDEILADLLEEQNHIRLNRMRSEIEEIRKEETLKKLGTEPYLNCSEFDGMTVIISLEQHIAALYRQFIASGKSSEYGIQLFKSFRHACETSSLPLAAEIRLESLFVEYEQKFSEETGLSIIDNMTGHDFEYWCASLLEKKGFHDVEVTPGSGDQGVDVIAVKEGVRYAIQCKCYSSDLGNTPVQEVHAGKSMYHCQVGAVMTNRHFTAGGKALAEATGVLLWDRDWIRDALESVQSI